MKILAIDSSGMTASVAVVDENAVIAEYNTNYKKTHSLTLLPMIDEMLKMIDMDLEEIDAVAISKGPGSFTGLRIGSATAKGLTLVSDKPIVEISSLEGMAYELYGFKGLICPIMDARRSQVYTGIYKFDGEKLVTVKEDTAIAISELIEELNKMNEEVIFLGDGVPVYKETIEAGITCVFSFAKNYQSRQRAAALGELALEYMNEGKTVSSDAHSPVYLRVSQAERERAEKLANK